VATTVNETDIMHIGVQAMEVAAKLAAPMLAVSLIVGIIVSLFQTVFSIQDQALSMVPRLAAGGLVLLFGGNWMLHQLVDFTTQMFNHIPTIAGGG
jgi:flagellar biosynthetic protein FliQ